MKQGNICMSRSLLRTIASALTAVIIVVSFIPVLSAEAGYITHPGLLTLRSETAELPSAGRFLEKHKKKNDQETKVLLEPTGKDNKSEEELPVMVYEYNTAYQLTEDDIQEMNGGNALIVRSNEGYVSTLIGKYYDKSIPIRPDDIMVTVEAALDSLNGVATLIGLQKGSRFLINYAAQDAQGYMFLTYQQRYGEQTITNSTLHIVLDPEGYTAALACSFTPGLGFAEEKELLTVDEAFEKAKKKLPDCKVWYPEVSEEAVIWNDEHLENCYVFFADNPRPNQSFENMLYIAVYITRSGELRWILPTSVLHVSVDTSYYPTEQYFDDLEPRQWTGKVNLQGEGIREITIDVSYNPHDGLYYMTDPIRKMAVADCLDFFYHGGTLTFLTSPDNTWEERDIAAMYNYQLAFDSYAMIGNRSPDGFDSPILLGRKYVDSRGKPADNACFMGQQRGWFTFVYSEINDYCYDLDVVGHEYTHAVTNATIAGNNYINDAGAINESYSDIMGQLIQCMNFRTADPDWLIAENSDEAERSMSCPEDYYQPSAIGGAYYVPNTSTPMYNYNDNGGVHQNSGILNAVAYRIYENGMTYEDMFRLFYTALQILTPANSYQDVYAALIFAAREKGREELEDVITQAFRDGCIIESEYTREELEREILPDGCSLITFGIGSKKGVRMTSVIHIYDALTGKGMMSTWPADDGKVYLALPGGRYFVHCIKINLNNGNAFEYSLYGNRWVDAEISDGMPIFLRNDNIKVLPDLE